MMHQRQIPSSLGYYLRSIIGVLFYDQRQLIKPMTMTEVVGLKLIVSCCDCLKRAFPGDNFLFLSLFLLL
jgi:hypothetical protein